MQVIKETCPHGSILPRGLKCVRGAYLIIRLKTEEGPFNKGCGLHTPQNERIARIALDDIRLKQRLGTFNLRPTAQRLKFSDARRIYWQKHFIEYTNPKTGKPRGVDYTGNSSALSALGSYFDAYYIDALKLKHLILYRKKRLSYDGVANGTVNKELAILSSLINMFRFWIESEIIDPVKMPVDKNGAAINPCKLLPDLEEIPRHYPYRPEILKALKDAAYIRGDAGMWAIIETELHTSLRKNDLKLLGDVEEKDGLITFVQSKTNVRITFPAIVKPKWSSQPFVNFDDRWEATRLKASQLLTQSGKPGCIDLQFRDLRKWGLKVIETQFSADDLSRKAGHSSSQTTKRWYLDGDRSQAQTIAPMVKATQKLLDEVTGVSGTQSGTNTPALDGKE